jgi:uncharacterized protein YceH (UPF0502 family)
MRATLQSNSKLPSLAAIEARVLGVLAEKQRTVPDVYPMSLNALTAGCNQKSSRNPVMEATDAQVQAAIDRLKTLNLAYESSSGRVARYAHNIERVLQISEPAAALLAVLMLRGPQTAGELRINTERLQKFADISAVEALLRELSERTAGALVAELPRQAGSRENRWAHLLCGAPAHEPAAPAQQAMQESDQGAASEFAALKAKVADLEAEVAELKTVVMRLIDGLATSRKTDA